ncbi:cytochrome c maturation protein CcmE [Aquibacillus salsiterrae]|uniref:Cytochrome c maturation protein CcmE n=1 Tax=Aquibacillus salsiterrae TaxID=2950439 RepID=A0A9X4AFZ5_9BACI|nr:cytochrome c maturation protein CcmE [Aquibacillus salsiterrae]MDC3418149.1 cytochrome c maturation protein CcmE [Aquibacillus salsiterrae]
MSKKVKVIVAFVLFFGVVGTLVYTSISSAATFYMTVDELKGNEQQAMGKPVKISGEIVGDSVEFDSDEILLTFEIRGKDDPTFRVPIEYTGVKPDSMNDGWEAIVEGELTQDGTFIATEVLVKCPSKYEAMEEDGEEPPKDDPATEETSEGGN